jgi:molybdopterin/thiamine biosynthesis adenylyltransferase
VGGTVALELAAAGVGKLIIAHGGLLRLNDLNRQLLMSTEHVGELRTLSLTRRLRELNPHVQVQTCSENISVGNAESLVQQSHLVISAAPLFEERLLMNAAAVKLGKPIIHASMYDMSASILCTRPGVDACLACVCPEPPSWWKREFPVFGAVAGVAGCIAAVEAIKLLTGLGESLAGQIWSMDFAKNHTRVLKVVRDPECLVCGTAAAL